MRPGDVIADRFEIERLAGTGGMGNVYRAIDRHTGAPVAVKVLAGVGVHDSDRFAREARALAELSHPRIVGYVAHGVTPSAFRYLAMEWLDGEDLSARLQRGPLALADTLTLGVGVAEALALAHARGVVHRDVKPGNLFLPGGDVARVKVLDFGLARLGAGTRWRSKSGVMMGTPGYVAPEQARGEREVGAPADVFALGCVLFECLTGRAAFVGEHLLAVLAKILLEETPRARDVTPELPPAVDDLLSRLMAKVAEERPASGAELVRALEDLRRAPAGEPRPPSGRFKARGLTRDERRLVSVVLAGRSQDPGAATAPTMSSLDDAASLLRVRTAANALGVRLERLADGSLVAALEGRGNAADQAAAAARCALLLRQALVDVPIVLATGQGVIAGRLPVGDVIDGAVKLLRAAEEAALDASGDSGDGDKGPAPASASASGHLRGQPIRLDRVTAGLLGTSFDVEIDADGLRLAGERRDPEAARRVLGKATPCVGRERELAVLEGLWQECISEPVARAALVTAPAGMGKSRLRVELLRRLRDRGHGVEPWVGRADALSAGATYGVLAQVARAALDIDLHATPEAQREALWRGVRARLPDEAAATRVGQFLAELAGVTLPPDEAPLLAAARRDPVLLGDHLRGAWEDFIAACTAAAPVMIVLEDLHWGDVPTVKLLDATLRARAEAPLMVLALARPEVHATFPGLWAERAVQEIRLGELSRKASERLVRQVLGDDAAPEVVERLVAQAGGHAFFLEELMRAEAEHDARAGAAPGSVLAMLQTRLEGLDGEPRRILRAASVLGVDFEWGGLVGLLGVGSPAAEAALREQLGHLVEREVLARGGAPDRWSFRHGLVREAAYAMLTDVDRALGHRLAGEWFAAQPGAEALRVAEHFERGGVPDKAAVWYQRGAAQLLTGNDLDGALARAAHARAAAGADEVLAGAAAMVEAEAHYWRGEHEQAEAAGQLALARLPAGDPRWYAAAGVTAAASGNLGHIEALGALVAQLRAAVPPAGVDAEAAGVPRAQALARAAVYLVYAGRPADARAVLAELPAVDDDAAHAWRHVARGVLALGQDSGAALSELEASVAAFERAGDVRNAALNRINAAFAMMDLGAYKQAERALRQVVTPAEKMGLANVLALAENNLGLALCRLGKLAESITVEHDALAAFEAQGDTRLVAASHTYLAQAHQALGERERAREHAVAAIERAHAHPPTRAYALAVLAGLALEDREVGAAVAHAGEAHDLLAQLGSVDEGEAFIRLTWARALAAADRHADAREVVLAARERLEARAAEIADPAWRRSFLEQVPENALTLQWAERV